MVVDGVDAVLLEGHGVGDDLAAGLDAEALAKVSHRELLPVDGADGHCKVLRVHLRGDGSRGAPGRRWERGRSAADLGELRNVGGVRAPVHVLLDLVIDGGDVVGEALKVGDDEPTGEGAADEVLRRVDDVGEIVEAELGAAAAEILECGERLGEARV